MQSDLPRLQLFCYVYELRSFTAAGKAAGVTPQAASRSIAKLETDVGAALFRRNTRDIEPTPAGHSYYQACRAAIDGLAAARQRLASPQSALTDTIRISVPTTYGHFKFLPSLRAFRDKHPDVLLDIEVSNRNVNFVRDHVDLSIRMGEIADTTVVARKLGHFSLGVFCSPSYAAARGIPDTPAELSAHACIAFAMPRTGRILPWSFGAEGKTYTPDPIAIVREDVLGLVSLAKAGLGLIQIYDYTVAGEVALGNLVEALSAYKGAARPFSVLYPRSSAARPAVRALIEHVLSPTRTQGVAQEA